jgi:DNA repair exonuclease SbcCD ATPase subunit
MARIVDSLGGDANPAELAGATGASQDAVEEILAQWQEHGLLGSAPDSRFHFAPSPRQKKTIAKHLSWWRDGAERERCIETLREEAYAGYVAHTRECMDALSRSLEEERAGRAAVESNLRGSVEAVAAATAQLEEARRNADTLRSELERARGEVAQANNMVSLKDQLIAQLMKEQDAHRVLERDHAELLKKHKELGEEFEKAVEAAREAEQLDVARMPWRLSAGTMTRAS